MSTPAPRALPALLLAAAALWHLFAVLAPPRIPPPAGTEGRDYASYHYAVQAAAEGLDPYDKAVLGKLARADATRRSVHPYFYPPPFLLTVAWSLPLELTHGFRVWFWLNELLLLLALAALWRWWRPLHEASGPTLAVAAALSFGVAYSQELGQANLGVLALMAIALGPARHLPWLAGALVGTAAMWKMSPALVLLWWLGRGEHKAVAAAVAAAVAWTLLSLPLVGLQHQLAFYTDVLPRFGSGDYNGLTIRIDMFGNHSLPNLYEQLAPGTDNRLSPVARALSALTAVAVGAATVALGRTTERRLDAEVAAACAVWLLMLLVPVYTYEHHLVLAVPALAFATVCTLRGQLPTPAVVATAYAWALLATPLPDLRQLVTKVVGEGTALAWFVQEAKLGAVLALLAVMLFVARRPQPPTGHP
jgi:hypothetical protein